MTKLEYFLLGFCILGIIFLVFSAIQILLLRAKIKEMWKQSATAETQIKDSVLDSVSSYSKLQIYSLKVNADFTRWLCNTSAKYFKDAVNLAVPYTQNLTVSCKTEVKYERVDYKSVGFLVLDPSIGAEELVTDCLNNRLRYLMMNNNVFDVRYSKDIENKIKETLRNESIFKGINNCSIVFLYNPQTPPTMNPSCVFNMKLFSGETIPLLESYNSINLRSALNLDATSSTSILVHALGYRTAK